MLSLGLGSFSPESSAVDISEAATLIKKDLY